MNKHILTILFCILASGCIKSNNDAITCLQITHRDGLEETISDSHELVKYNNVNFQEPQNFQKIVKHYKKHDRRVSSIMTYHKNGSLEALLETKNARANGRFLQYHDNGNLFIQSHVIEGKADLSNEAKKSFIFDGIVKVYDTKENCISQMHYKRGKLEGCILEYWSNGSIKTNATYHQGKIHGLVEHFNENGKTIGQENYQYGVKDGISSKKNNFHERYEMGLLMQANYFNKSKKPCFGIKDGNGLKPIYENNKLKEIVEFRDGKKNGLVKTYSQKGCLINKYSMIDGKKEGLEECYFDDCEKKIKLQIPWKADEIHGMVKTYYPNQKLESQTEMVQSKKHGLCIAYYENATLMMMEKYQKGKLIDGKYYRINEESCTSSIENGDGLASIFNKDGEFLRTLEYKNHKIQINEDEEQT